MRNILSLSDDEASTVISMCKPEIDTHAKAFVFPKGVVPRLDLFLPRQELSLPSAKLCAYLEETERIRLPPPCSVEDLSTRIHPPGAKDMYPFQRASVNVMLTSPRKRFLLADQMGLGKTIQAIGVISGTLLETENTK